MMKEIVLTPTYMNSFSCIGSDCEDSCCIGWQVTLNKKTYQKYKKIKHAELSVKLNKGLKRIKNQTASDSKYAYFSMDSEKRCPMLNEKNLCGLQLNFGEDMLSPVCTTYPRMLNKIDQEYELSAKLSCPEIARLALLNPDGIDFDKKEYEVNKNWSTMMSLKTDGVNNGNLFSWEVREFAIDIVQNRKLKISDRLIFLGLFMNRLQEILDRKNYQEINRLVNEYQQKINNPAYLHSLENINDSLSLQIETILELIAARKRSGVTSSRYLECFNDMIRGLDLDGKEEILKSKLEDTYLYNYTNYYLPFMNEHEYIFENYVVNYMFESMFPNMASGKIFKDYTKLSTIFAMLKVHFVGISGYSKGLSTDQAIKIIQSFVRAIEHNGTYLSGMMELLEENGFTTLAHIASLLKDRKSEEIHVQ